MRKLLMIIGIILLSALCILAYRSGILTDKDKMVSFVSRAGIFGPALFILIQVIQVVIPIFPGGVSCLAGVLLFGSVLGFILNYVGICIGSVILFFIARRYGRPFIERTFSAGLMAKYDRVISENRGFERFFALAIFFPFAPDDFLCALAGTTDMSIFHFALIIILGKPLSILLYSLFLETGWKFIFQGA